MFIFRWIWSFGWHDVTIKILLLGWNISGFFRYSLEKLSFIFILCSLFSFATFLLQFLLLFTKKTGKICGLLHFQHLSGKLSCVVFSPFFLLEKSHFLSIVSCFFIFTNYFLMIVWAFQVLLCNLHEQTINFITNLKICFFLLNILCN